MNTTVKLFFTVLVSMLLTACGSGGGKNNPDTNPPVNPPPNILSEYLSETFPAFDDSLYSDNITYSFRYASFIQVSSSDAESFYNTLINEKHFNADGAFGSSEVLLEPENFDDHPGFNYIYAHIGNGDNIGGILGDYFISLTMTRQGGNLSEAYFDEVFGRPNGVPDFENVNIEYENVNMTTELNSYYEALISSSVFTEEECNTDGQTYWSCYYGFDAWHEGKLFYEWNSYYNGDNLYISFSKGKFIMP